MIVEYLHILIMLTITVGIIYFRYLKGNDFRLIFLLVTLNLIAELIANFLWIKLNSNNTIVYNIVVYYNFIIWLIIFIKKNQRKMLLIFTSFYILDLTLFHNFFEFTSYSFLVGTYFIVYLHLSFFYNNFIKEQNDLQISSASILLRLSCLLYHIGFATLLFINDWGATEFYVFQKISLYQLIAIVINTIFYGMLILFFHLLKTSK